MLNYFGSEIDTAPATSPHKYDLKNDIFFEILPSVPCVVLLGYKYFKSINLNFYKKYRLHF